jgi:hypothetical protein
MSESRVHQMMTPKPANTGLGVIRSKLSRPFRRLKLPVHAAADDVVDHPDVGIETGSRQEGVRTEIHEQVFDFYRHALAQHFLEASADGEAYASCRLGKGGRAPCP